jgi:hypothetical protein
MTREDLIQRLEDGLQRLLDNAAPSYDYEDAGERQICLSLSRLRSCPRQLIFSFLTSGYESEDLEEKGYGEADRGWGVLAAGVWWEEFLAQYVFPDFKRQCKVSLLGIIGHCDFLKHDETEQRVTVLEIKTRYETPDAPLQHHYVQLNAYLLGIKENGYWLSDGTHITENIQTVEGSLIYLNRDNPADFAIFHFPQPDETVRQIVEEAKRHIEDFLQNGVIPPIPKGYQPFRFPCFIETRYDVKLCPFHINCWGKAEEATGDISPLLVEGFRRWLSYKESEENYKRFVDSLIRPLFSNLEKSLSYPVTYLNESGVFRVIRRKGQRRLDPEILRQNVERLIGRKLTDDEWKKIYEEAMVEGEGSTAIEFRRLKG